MRNVLTVLLLTASLALGASVASAQAPIDGVWKTQDGDFLEGRYSVSWPGANGYEDLGNIIHLESFDGTLGGEWRVYCPVITGVNTLYVIPIAPGTYNAAYLITYVGGSVFLDGAGPWGGGDPSYTGSVTLYTEVRSVQVVNNVLTGLDSNHNLEATIQGYTDDCVTFAIGNTAWIGDTPQHGAKPADYPAYLDGACLGNGTAGHWGTATDLTVTVQGCPVSTEEATWGSVKAKYR